MPSTTDVHLLRRCLEESRHATLVLSPVHDEGGALVDLAFRLVSPQVQEQLGVEPESLRDRLMSEAVLPDYFRDVHERLLKVQRTGVPLEVDQETGNNIAVIGSHRVRAVRIEDGVLVTIEDVTEQALVRHALERSEARHRLLSDHVTDLITLHADDGTFMFLSPSAEQLDWEEWSLVGTLIQDQAHPHDVGDLRDAWDAVVQSELPETVVFRARTGAGAWVWLESTLSLHPESRQVVAVSRNVTDRKALEEELRRLAETDPLTGVANRRSFLEQLEHAIDQHPEGGVTVLLLDVDDFKSVNDSFGHPAGDEALRTLTRSVLDVIRSSDVLGRLGGEEFAVLLPMLAPTAAREMAERVRINIAERPVRSPPHAFLISVSIGMATGGPDERSDAVLKRSDEALYQAKETGRNRVCVSEELNVGPLIPE